MQPRQDPDCHPDERLNPDLVRQALRPHHQPPEVDVLRPATRKECPCSVEAGLVHARCCGKFELVYIFSYGKGKNNIQNNRFWFDAKLKSLPYLGTSPKNTYVYYIKFSARNSVKFLVRLSEL